MKRNFRKPRAHHVSAYANIILFIWWKSLLSYNLTVNLDDHALYLLLILLLISYNEHALVIHSPMDILTVLCLKFTQVTENGKQERHLVATVGKFSVIWNFQQVKNGSHECYQNQEGLKSCYCYKIVLKDDSIVDSRFMHDKFAVSDLPEAPLVIATPMKVSSFSISSRQC